MPPRDPAAIPPAPRKTLLEWIETDDGNTTSTQPESSAAAQAFHAQVAIAPGEIVCDPAERVQAPAGLRLGPLG